MVMNTGEAVQQRSVEDMTRQLQVSEEPKKKQGFKGAGSLHKRLAAVAALLSKETDEGTIAELQQRKARMERKLANKQASKASPGGLTKRLVQRKHQLINKIEKNASNPAKKAMLEQRKAAVDARLLEIAKSAEQNRQTKNREDTNKDKSAPAFPFLTKQLANIEEKLKLAKNDDNRAALEQRKANVLAKLAAKKQAQKNKERPLPLTTNDKDDDISMDEEKVTIPADAPALAPTSVAAVVETSAPTSLANFPGLAKQLANIEQKLTLAKNNCARLEQCKANVLAKLAAKQAEKTKAISLPILPQEEDTDDDDVSMDEKATITVEDSVPAPTSLAAFPGLAKQLANIEEKLKRVKNDDRRANLEGRKAKVLAKLVAKQQNQMNKNRPGLKKRLAKIQAMLKKDNLTDARKNELEKVKVGLLIKIEDEQRSNSCSERLDLAEELSSETQDEERCVSLEERVLQLQGVAAKENNMRNANDNKKRENQKQRFIQMEKNARANNDEVALNRIALQQVYVAHYPDSAPHYIPVHAQGPNMIAKRAALRAQAIEAARTETAVDWISADMYERLPRQDWTLDDEKAMFAAGKNNKNHGGNHKGAPPAKAPPSTDVAPASEAEEDAFVNVNVESNNEFDYDANQKTAGNEEGWTEVNEDVAPEPTTQKVGHGRRARKIMQRQNQARRASQNQQKAKEGDDFDMV